MQILHTKKFGSIEVERSWVNGPHHIAKCTNGAYVHITGLPIQNASELKAVLTGSDLEEALHWFERRHDLEENPPRRIMFEADGTPIFEDGMPVESPSDLVQSLQPGPVLDAALMALALKQAKKIEAEKAARTKAGGVAKGMGKKTAPAAPKSMGKGKVPAFPKAVAQPAAVAAPTV